MAFKFPSDEWIKELSRQLNESETYEKSAKDWEGDFDFVVEPDEAERLNRLLEEELTGRSGDTAP